MIRALLVVLSLVFCALGVRELLVRGGPARARTIVSRTGFSPGDSQDAIVLLQEAAVRIPAGAAVRVRRPDRPSTDGVLYAVAVGQLPRQIVLSSDAPQPAAYLVVFHGGENEPGFTEIWRGGEGTILRRE